MTPDEYPARWDLPSDYPIVSPNYTQKRREVAKSSGLGRKNQTAPRSASEERLTHMLLPVANTINLPFQLAVAGLALGSSSDGTVKIATIWGAKCQRDDQNLSSRSYRSR